MVNLQMQFESIESLHLALSHGKEGEGEGKGVKDTEPNYIVT